jgi:hypothetical protein
MNSRMRIFIFCLALLAEILFSAAGFAQGKKNLSGEEFFLISSVDVPKSQILLKRPTEVTLLMKVSDKTQIRDENGKLLGLSDLHAGNTVWVKSSPGEKDQPVANSIRKGPMTVQDLHRYFLDYPVI